MNRVSIVIRKEDITYDCPLQLPLAGLFLLISLYQRGRKNSSNNLALLETPRRFSKSTERNKKCPTITKKLQNPNLSFTTFVLLFTTICYALSGFSDCTYLSHLKNYKQKLNHHLEI